MVGKSFISRALEVIICRLEILLSPLVLHSYRILFIGNLTKSAVLLEQALLKTGCGVFASLTVKLKASRYASLVVDGKQCRQCSAAGLTIPSCVQEGQFDSCEIGPWTRWNGDLNARLLVVGQEWGDVASLERQKGLDAPSPTNNMLLDLLKFSGITACKAPHPSTAKGVFLTNAALCLKVGGAQAPVNEAWFKNCSRSFLREQVEVVQPAVVVTHGEKAYHAMRDAFSLPRAGFRRAVNLHQPIPLPTGGFLVPVYRCGQRILNTRRKREAQFKDWELARDLLAAPVGA